ncbi:hypothetical protein M378DRAFT_158708 [Amanita muscaria Koide BX008]|uniref:Manganese/iron superoxide dismutase C-terminal domain-containing protein n=1 Tax=Amanita muscaria (strain Koide BX008) TaxID=946122 RepID=A0A0C2XGV6_AMAMK|nr:hypothetical protein M378DRAFT_158708 [Amanita muscaria Koide BX008]
MNLYSTSSKAARIASLISRAPHIRWCTRGLHQRRALLYKLEDGLGEFLPPPALKTVAVDWQQGLLDRLNEEVKDTEDEGLTLAQTVINTAAREDRTLAFNYASLALNNGFFLDHLRPPPPAPARDHSDQISAFLADNIRNYHGSLAQLKSEFSAAVLGMFTSGWVWFVTDKGGNTGVLPTYGPGTLLIRSRTYMAHARGPSLGDVIAKAEAEGSSVEHEFHYESGEKLNLSRPSSSSPARSPTAQPSPPGVSPSSPASGVPGTNNNPSGSNPLHPRFYSTFGLGTAPSIFDQGGIEQPMSKVETLNVGEVLYPLFCISVHEHAWMAAGYGVWDKEEWLKKFWSVVDWEKISQAYDAVAKR